MNPVHTYVRTTCVATAVFEMRNSNADCPDRRRRRRNDNVTSVCVHSGAAQAWFACNHAKRGRPIYTSAVVAVPSRARFIDSEILGEHTHTRTEIINHCDVALSRARLPDCQTLARKTSTV